MQTFEVLTKIKAGPLSKIALAKRSLRSKPTGLMCPPPESELEKREEADFENLETILFFFHTKCEAAVAAVIPGGDQTLFFANVDGIAAEAFVKTRDGGQRQGRKDAAYKVALLNATAKYWEQLSRRVHFGA